MAIVAAICRRIPTLFTLGLIHHFLPNDDAGDDGYQSHPVCITADDCDRIDCSLLSHNAARQQ